ncbi:MAG: FCD domain-containing protein [Paracoccaceae bacterium]
MTGSIPRQNAIASRSCWAAGRRAHPRDIQAEHGAIADAALARDADTAVRLLADHYGQTAATIRSRMARAA